MITWRLTTLAVGVILLASCEKFYWNQPKIESIQQQRTLPADKKPRGLLQVKGHKPMQVEGQERDRLSNEMNILKIEA